MKRPKRVVVFSSTHHFNNSSVRVLACVYCSFSFHYYFFFWKNLFFVFFPAIWNPANLAKQWNQNRFGSIRFGRTWKNLRLNRSNPYEKIQTNQPIKSIWNQNQIKPIKRIYPTNPLPINPSNPPSINPSTTTEFWSTHQTHRRSTHPPPSSSQIKPIKPTADQPIKTTVDQPIHHHRVPKSRK